MQDYWHFDFQCPFFGHDERTRVYCEGGTRLAFPTVGQIKRHFGRYCCSVGAWQECPVAKMLLDYYEQKYKT